MNEQAYPFDKREALEEIEDALTDLSTPRGRGQASGLCGGLYLCGMISKTEWEEYMERIPAEPDDNVLECNEGADMSQFKQYLELSDSLVRIADKELVAECARLLALNVAHYQMKYGEMPLEETYAMIGMTKPNAEQLQLMCNGMEIFAGMLGNMVAGIGEQKH